MIEINLVPDVKQDLIRAKRARNFVVFGAIAIGIIAVAIVVLLAVYHLAIQTVRSSWVDGDIKANASKLEKTPDLANMLTVQSQLANVSSLHESKNISSRVLDLLVAVNPSAPNQVSFSSFKFNAENSTIHIDAQAAGGFVAADVFKKTIQKATFTYQIDGESNVQTIPLVADVLLSNLSYGEDVTGAKVLRFSADLEYSPELFAATSQNVRIVRPDHQNATDSHKYLPASLFRHRAADIGGTQ